MYPRPQKLPDSLSSMFSLMLQSEKFGGLEVPKHSPFAWTECLSLETPTVDPRSKQGTLQSSSALIHVYFPL